MADRRQRRVSSYSQYYRSSGNLAAAPDRIETERRKREREYLRNARSQVEKKVVESSRQSRVYTFPQLAVLALSFTLLLGAGSAYILQLSQKSSYTKEAASLSLSLQELIKDNASLQNQYEGNIDYEGIYEYAVSRGMTVPGKQQVITYEKTDSEYVTKDGEIPDEK